MCVKCYIRQQRKQIHLGIVLHTLVHFPVHMNGHIGDHAEISVDIHQSALYTVPVLHSQSASDGEWSVQPGGQDHAAVFFGVQTQIMLLHGQFRLLFDLKAGGITVGCCHMKAPDADLLFRNHKRNNGRIIALRIIPSALFQFPFFLFL